jgi:hypothetical protein
MSDLAEVLNGTEEVETQQEAEVVETETPETTETTETTTGEETAVTTPVTEEPPDVAGLKAALLAERQKRQQYEDWYRAQQAKETPPEPVDVWEKPEEFINRAVTQAEQRFTNRLLDMSEAAARGRHQDFDSKLEVFAQLAQRDPALRQSMVNAPDPGEYAYRTAERFQVMQEMGDPVAYKAKVRAEIEAEYRTKFEAESKEKFNKELTDRLPPSMTETRAVGGNKPLPWTGPPSIKDVLG